MSIDDVLKRTKIIIAEHGWSVINVKDSPAFSYTVGLTETLGHAELLMFGLDPEIMRALLNNAGRRIRAKGRIAPYSLVSEVVADHPCYSLPVDLNVHRGLSNIATALYGRGNYELMQLVWPDAVGRFPFQNGFDTTFAAQQPVVGRVTPDSH